MINSRLLWRVVIEQTSITSLSEGREVLQVRYT